MDEMLLGAKHIQAIAEKEALDQKHLTTNKLRQQAILKNEVAKIIDSDEVIRLIRVYTRANYEAALAKLLDPSKRHKDDNTENLRAEAAAHRRYVELFDVWEREGKDALRKILEQEKSNSE